MERGVADWTTWVVIAVAGVALAVCTFAATRAASSANGAWQDAVRVEARHTSATLENIRTVYEDEAPLALSITAALVRAQELDRRGDAGSFVAVEADAERRTADVYLDTFRRRVPDSPVTRLLGSGDDPEAVSRTRPLGAHLVSLQESARGAADEAAGLWAAGDHDAARTRGFLWGMAASAAVVLAGFAVGEGRHRSRSRTTADGSGLVSAVGLALTPLLDARHRLARRVLALRLAAALLFEAAVGGVLLRGRRAPTGTGDDRVAVIGLPPLPVLPPERRAPKHGRPDRSPLPSVVLAVAAVVTTALQIDASTTENRYLAVAAHGADRVGTVVVGNGFREAFDTDGKQSVVFLQQRANAVAAVGRDAPAANRALAAGLAAADRAAAARIETVVADLAAPPSSADGLDQLSTTALSASWLDREAEQRAQAEAASAAEAAGSRSDGLVGVLLALALAANAVEIGHSPRLGAASPYVVGLGWMLAAASAAFATLVLLMG